MVAKIVDDFNVRVISGYMDYDVAFAGCGPKKRHLRGLSFLTRIDIPSEAFGPSNSQECRKKGRRCTNSYPCHESRPSFSFECITPMIYDGLDPRARTRIVDNRLQFEPTFFSTQYDESTSSTTALEMLHERSPVNTFCTTTHWNAWPLYDDMNTTGDYFARTVF